MKKIIVSCAIATAVLVSPAAVSAGGPRVSNCIGTTSSTNAQLLGGLGERRSSFAKDQDGFGGPGFGDEMQLLQAGGVPDSIAPNTCNDLID